MLRLYEKARRWNLDRKLIALISTGFLIVILIVILVNNYWYSSEANQQMKNMIEEQMYYLEDSYEYALNICKGQAQAIMIDDSVQNYLLSDGVTDPSYHLNFSEARNVLTTMLNSSPGMNFIVLFSENYPEFLYHGNVANSTGHVRERLDQDYANGLVYGVDGKSRITYGSVAYPDNETMTVYFPVYSTLHIGKQLGMICMNYSTAFMHSLYEIETRYDSKLDVFLMDTTGRTLPGTDSDRFSEYEQVTGDSGSFREDNKLYTYRRLARSSVYLINEAESARFFKSYRNIMLLMTLILLLAGSVCIFLARISVRIMYNDVDVLVKAMEEVQQGNLSFRIDRTSTGEDFIKLKNGFNYMMDQVEQLIEKVKVEQRQEEQLRFNVLQEQIKPHFLYNALECIHWQARLNQGKVVSDMVRALAQYYRGSLSRGKEIIPLREELKILENYIFIQNMRFDNVMTIRYELTEDELEIPIPKLTLQPLIENSIIHGTGKRTEHGVEIVVRAQQSEDCRMILMEDNGRGMTAEEIAELNCRLDAREEGKGYGILNVHKRIQLLCGDPYGLHYTARQPHGVCVQIRLPGEEKN